MNRSSGWFVAKVPATAQSRLKTRLTTAMRNGWPGTLSSKAVRPDCTGLSTPAARVSR